LLSNNSFSLDFLNTTRGVPNEPLSSKQLNRLESLIFDSDEICEDELALQNIGLPVQIDGLNGDSNSFRRCCVGGHVIRYGQRA
jgi:hypothetical protein